MALALLVLPLASGCAVNPATGRPQLMLISQQEANALGAEAKPELVDEYGGEVQASALRAYVTEIGMKLVEHVEPEYKDLDWDFTVLDSDVINAFALPGGHVFISRGLLEYFTNEAQIAGVLGHEIGHVSGLHVNERISQAMGIQGIVLGASAAVGSSESSWAEMIPLVVNTAGQGYLLKFGRDQESEADVLGVRYMVRSGYNPQGMLQVLEVLDQASQGQAPPEFLSTHPHPSTRIATVNGLLSNEYAYTQNNADFGLYENRFHDRAVPHLNLRTFSAGAMPVLAMTGCCAGAHDHHRVVEHQHDTIRSTPMARTD